MNVKVTLRNPFNKQDQITYYIEVYDTPIAKLWYRALEELLTNKKYLEKNFCFLGFPNTPRTLTYICNELDWVKEKINIFFKNEYEILETFQPELMFTNLTVNNDLMNRLHRHFEILQGTVSNLSNYYRRADYKTKFAIRQLNNLCHEAESLMLSLRKQQTAPQWVRPSQITTFLNAPRYLFPSEYKKTFNESNYDRRMGEVYLHWAQIGKTIFEVYRDEKGVDITDATCSAITNLNFYSGEFDVEWGRDIVFGGNFDWHNKDLSNFKSWLERNNFNIDDKDINYGYHSVGKVNLQKSFETEDYTVIWKMLSDHLDIINISTDNCKLDFNYNWTDENYYWEQIKLLMPGYDHSSKTLRKV